jgi:hypothetical protein
VKLIFIGIFGILFATQLTGGTHTGRSPEITCRRILHLGGNDTELVHNSALLLRPEHGEKPRPMLGVLFELSDGSQAMALNSYLGNNHAGIIELAEKDFARDDLQIKAILWGGELELSPDGFTKINRSSKTVSDKIPTGYNGARVENNSANARNFLAKLDSKLLAPNIEIQGEGHMPAHLVAGANTGKAGENFRHDMANVFNGIVFHLHFLSEEGVTEIEYRQTAAELAKSLAETQPVLNIMKETSSDPILLKDIAYVEAFIKHGGFQKHATKSDFADLNSAVNRIWKTGFDSPKVEIIRIP